MNIKYSSSKSLFQWFLTGIYPVTDAVNKRTRELITNWATKAGKDAEQVLQFADQWDNPAEQQYAAKWVLQDPSLSKEKVDYAFRICRSKKIDPSKSNPQDLIAQYGDTVAEKKSKSGYIPEQVFGAPVKDFGNGTVAYLAEGKQKECRDAINRFFGPQANPWCLLQGDGKGNLSGDAVSYWHEYSAYPKWIVFHNGQLLAFSAGDDEDYREYWDRFDRSFTFPPVPGTSWEHQGYKYTLQKDGTIDWEYEGTQGYINEDYNASPISKDYGIDAYRHNEYTTINGKNYRDAKVLDDGFYAVKEGDKYKIINTEGQSISDQLFDDVSTSLVNGIFRVRLDDSASHDDKWNFLKSDGTYLSDQWFDSIDCFYDGFAEVNLGGIRNFIKPDGTILSDQWFDGVDRFRGAFAAVKLHRKWNYLKRDGTLLSDQWFDTAWGFQDGFAEVRLGNGYNYLKRDGTLLSDDWFTEVSNFSDGIARVRSGFCKYNFIKSDGTYLSDQWFDGVGDFYDGLAGVYDHNKYNYIKRDGTLLSDQWFDDADNFCQGFAAVKLNGESTWINTSGQIVDSKRTLYDSRVLGWFFTDRYPVTDAVNKRTRELITNWATKVGQDPSTTLQFADQWDNPAEQQYAAKWVLQDPSLSKEKVDYAFRICRSKKIDPSKSNPTQLIEQYGDTVAEKKSKSGYNPEQVFGAPVKDFGNGTVAYLAEGKQKECRDAINRFFGPQANPWCLLKGDGKGNLEDESYEYWDDYCCYPKWIVFHNGQLLAFSAGADEDYREYWDRFDRSFTFPPVPGTSWEHQGYKYTLQKDGTIDWEKDGKQGYIDEQYSSDPISQDDAMYASRHKVYSILGNSKFKGSIKNIGKGLYVIEEGNNKYKVVNSEGQPISDQWFDGVSVFINGFACVRLNDKCNFIKRDGTLLSDQWFDVVYDFEDGLAKVMLNDKYNFISTEGQILSDQWFDVVYRFNEGFAPVRLNDKYNYLKRDGTLLSDQWFDDVTNFCQGFASVKLNGKWHRINTKGQIVDSKHTLYDSRVLGWFFTDRYPVTDAVNKRTRELITNWATKVGQDPSTTLQFADQWDNPADQQYAAKWVLQDPSLDKEKVDYAFRICRSKKIDPSKSNPQDLISKYGSEVAEKKSKSGYNPEQVFGAPVKDFGNGTVAYLAEGKQKECRDAINRFFGPQANPWCLLKGDGKGNLSGDASSYWRRYSAYPKWIVFHNGQLLAFSAGDDEDYREYWDRFDRSFTFPPVPGTSWENSGYKYTLQKDGTIDWEKDGKQGYIDEQYSAASIDNSSSLQSRHRDYTILGNSKFKGSPESIEEGFYVIEEGNNKYKVVNSEGQPISDQWFDAVYDFEDGLAKVMLNRKMNFLSSNGSLLSDQWFDAVYDFEDGLAKVMLNDKENFIKRDGTLLSDQWFDAVYDFEDGLVKVMLNDKYNFISTEGQILSDQWFDKERHFNNGFACVSLSDKWNFISSEGQILSDQWFDYASGFVNGHASVKIDGMWNFINSEGTYLSDQWFDGLGGFSDGFAEVKLKRKMNFISTEGQILSDQWFDEECHFNNGFACVSLSDKWNFISSEGQILSDQWFDDTDDFSDGFAKVKLNGKYNFISSEGQILSNQWFDYASGFVNGHAAVKIDGEWHNINTKGQIIDSYTMNVKILRKKIKDAIGYDITKADPKKGFFDTIKTGKNFYNNMTGKDAGILKTLESLDSDLGNLAKDAGFYKKVKEERKDGQSADAIKNNLMYQKSAQAECKLVKSYIEGMLGNGVKGQATITCKGFKVRNDFLYFTCDGPYDLIEDALKDCGYEIVNLSGNNYQCSPVKPKGNATPAQTPTP